MNIELRQDPYIRALNDLKAKINKDQDISAFKGPYAINKVLDLIKELKDARLK